MRFDPLAGASSPMGTSAQAAPSAYDSRTMTPAMAKQPKATGPVVMANSAAGAPMARQAPGAAASPMSAGAPLARAYMAGGAVAGGSSRGCGLARPGRPGKGGMR